MLKVLDELNGFKFEILEDEKTDSSYSLIEDLLVLLEQICNNENDDLKKIKKYQSKIQKASEAFADKNSAGVTFILEALLKNKIDLNNFKELFAYEDIVNCYDSISRANAILLGKTECDSDEEAVIDCWKKNSVDILKELYTNDPESYIWLKIRDSIKENVKTIVENEAHLNTRRKLYLEYFEDYQLV